MLPLRDELPLEEMGPWELVEAGLEQRSTRLLAEGLAAGAVQLGLLAIHLFLVGICFAWR